MTALLVSAALALVAGVDAAGVQTVPSYYGRTTSGLDDGRVYMELPGHADGTGMFLQPPAAVWDIIGRRGAYRVRFTEGQAAAAEVQAWLPELCAPMGLTVGSVRFVARPSLGDRDSIDAEVTCR